MSDQDPQRKGDPLREPEESPPRPPRPERPRKFPRYSVDELDFQQDEFGHKRFFTPTGRPVCGRMKRATNRKIPKEACLGQPMANGACRMHGGASPGGPLRAGGRYSRVLGAWKPAFERALQDKDLLDTRRDLALMDSMIEDLLDRIAAGDAPRWRAELERTFEELDAAVRSGRQREVGPLLKRLGDQVREGAKLDAAVKDVMRHVDTRTHRAHKINELSVKRERLMTAKDVGVIFAQFLELLVKHLGVQEYTRVIPHLDAFMRQTGVQRIVGSAVEQEKNEAATAKLHELEAQARELRNGSQRR